MRSTSFVAQSPWNPHRKPSSCRGLEQGLTTSASNCLGRHDRMVSFMENPSQKWMITGWLPMENPMKMDDDWGYLHDFEENTIRLEAEFVQRSGVFGQLLSEMFELSLNLIFTRNFNDSLDFSPNMLDCSGLILDFSIKRLDLKQILLSSTHCPSTSWIKELYPCLSSTHCHSIFTRSHRRIFHNSHKICSTNFITFHHFSSLFVTFHHCSSLFIHSPWPFPWHFRQNISSLRRPVGPFTAAPSAQQQLNVGAGKWAPRIAGDQVFPDPKTVAPQWDEQN